MDAVDQTRWKKMAPMTEHDTHENGTRELDLRAAENRGDETAAFGPVQWFGTEPGSPYGPPPPAPPAGPPAAPGHQRPRRRYVDMALSAVVAAVVAAGTTAAV